MQHCTKQTIPIRLECYQICVTLVALTGSDVKRSWLFFADFHFCCLLCRVQFRWKAISSGHLLDLRCPFQKAAVKCSLLTSFSLPSPPYSFLLIPWFIVLLFAPSTSSVICSSWIHISFSSIFHPFLLSIQLLPVHSLSFISCSINAMPRLQPSMWSWSSWLTTER